MGEKFALFSEHWSPKIIGEMNDQYVKVATGQGQMLWHDHAGEDELFWVIEGHLAVQLRDAGGTVSDVVLGPGEIFIVPKGAWHRPIAAEEVRLVLVEPKATTHTGSVRDEMAVEVADQHWI